MYKTEVKHMENLGDLGSGTCGHVVKMLHKPSQTVIAVKVNFTYFFFSSLAKIALYLSLLYCLMLF